MNNNEGRNGMPDSTTVRIPGRYTAIFTVGGALIGLIAAFIVGPVVSWLIGLIGDAPGPLRLAAELPFAWAVPVLTVVGAVGGFVIVATWVEGAGTIEVGNDGITVHSKNTDRHLPKSVMQHIFAEKSDLVVLGDGAREVYRGAVEDELLPGLRKALADRGYPRLESADPYGDDFVPWTEGVGDVDDECEVLLLARRRALMDDRPGAAEEALDELRRRGIMVRDRDGHQQFRRAGRP